MMLDKQAARCTNAHGEHMKFALPATFVITHTLSDFHHPSTKLVHEANKAIQGTASLSVPSNTKHRLVKLSLTC
jgi:hypothetical protein